MSWISRIFASLLLVVGLDAFAAGQAVVTGTELVEQAKQQITEVQVDELDALRQRGAIVVDVREPPEVEKGSIPDAEAVPRGVLEFRIAELAQPDQPVVLYCRSGGRSALAAQTLENMGYQEVYSLAGGYRAWAEENRE